MKYRDQLYAPDYSFGRLADVDFRLLCEEKGVRHALIDLDCTFVPGHSNVPDRDGMINVMLSLKSGLLVEVCILSNAGFWPYSLRAQWIARKCGFKCHTCVVPFPLKPAKAAFEKAANKFESRPDDLSTIVVIDDQLWTGIVGGNDWGATTVHVDPLGRVSARKRQTHQHYQALALSPS